MKAEVSPLFNGRDPTYTGWYVVTQGDDDQIVPIDDASRLSVKLKNGTLKVYPSYPHGMLTTHADVINVNSRHRLIRMSR